MKAPGLYFIICIICVGCAGPMTPFGAIMSLVPDKQSAKPPAAVAAEAIAVPVAKQTAPSAQPAADRQPAGDVAPAMVRQPSNILQKTQQMLLGSGSKPVIKFTPDRQVLHGRSNFVIRIKDDAGIARNPDLTILYNGHDLTHRFLAQAKTEVIPATRTLKLSFPNLRVQADREHKIEVVYRHSKYDPYVFARYQPPTCDITEYLPVLKTGTFKIQPNLMKSIEKLAHEHKVNPSFLTGLIAQESAFNQHAISWSKAIGLTQITSLAEQEVTKFYSHWPRYEGVGQIPLPMLKTMIVSGQINSTNEWRLNPQMSIRGGLTYLTLLSNYWRRPDNFAKIAAQFKDPEEGFSQVILASYNSGFVRVGSAIERSGTNWIRESDLKEARKYVGRVLSYCYHFSHQGEEDAEST